MTVGLRAKWTDENADQAILDLRDQAEVETDPEARVALFAQIQDYLQQSSPWAPFIIPGVQAAYRADLKGYAYNPQWLLDVAQLSR